MKERSDHESSNQPKREEYSGTILRMDSVDARYINGDQAGLYYDLTLEVDRWIKINLNCIPEDWINILPA